MSKNTLFQAKRSHCLTSSGDLGAGSLYVFWSTIIQMVSRGFTSHEIASRSTFAIKFSNPPDTISACVPPFSLQGFPTFAGHISSYRCARNFDIVKLKFSFYLAVLLNYYAYTYSFFDNIFHTVCKKKPAIYSLVCLVRSFLLTTCSLTVQTSSTI